MKKYVFFSLDRKNILYTASMPLHRRCIYGSFSVCVVIVQLVLNTSWSFVVRKHHIGIVRICILDIRSKSDVSSPLLAPTALLPVQIR